LGRRVQKNKGVLVYMGRRRTPGIGVIIDKTPKPPKEMTDHEKSLRSPSLLRDYQVNLSEEVCALVHWLKRPSAWESEQTYNQRTWVPLSWLRIYKKEISSE